MELFIKSEDGKEVMVKDISTISSDAKVLILFLNRMLTREHIEELESDLTKKIGIKTVILDAGFTGRGYAV